MVYSATTKSANPVQQPVDCNSALESSLAEMDGNGEEDMEDVVLWYNQW